MNERQKPDLLTLHIDPSIDLDSLLAKASKALQKDGPLKRRLSEEKFQILSDYVQQLLKGEAIPLQDIMRTGLDPNLVESKATRILRGYQFQLSDVARLERRLSEITYPTREDRLLQDPNRFLGDTNS